jgi:DNA-binding MarR family transcriptional regulator
MHEQQLQALMQTIIRQFGLLQADQTPCGQSMSPSMAHALQLLARTPRLTQQALAAQLRLEKSTTSRLVSALLERDWIERVENSHDRREQLLSLSATGRDVATQLMQASSIRYNEIWQRLPVEKRPDVLNALATLAAAIEEVR